MAEKKFYEDDLKRLRKALELAATWGIISKGFDAQTAHELGHWVDAWG